MNWTLETEKLGFRELNNNDFNDLKVFLSDIEVMQAWGHGFTDDEIHQWIGKNIVRYAKDGFSYYALEEKSSGQLVGVMGPLIEDINGENHVGIAYILSKKFWGSGYSTEGAKAVVDYAFNKLGAKEVIAEIRPENVHSKNLAERLGMTVRGSFIKLYKGEEMEHLIYSITRNDNSAL